MVSAEVVIPLQNCALAEHTRSQVELLDLITPVFISPELLPLNIEQESQKKDVASRPADNVVSLQVKAGDRSQWREFVAASTAVCDDNLT